MWIRLCKCFKLLLFLADLLANRGVLVIGDTLLVSLKRKVGLKHFGNGQPARVKCKGKLWTLIHWDSTEICVV